MIVPLLILLFLLLCFLKIVLIGREKYGTLENSGFPVVEPTLFLGSIPDFYKKIQHDEDVERAKKYGGIWGLYEGKEPQVFLCDPDIIKQICIKDFDHFHSRRQLNVGPIASEILDLLQGDTWKTMRSHLSPLFTTAKLKWLNTFIDGYFKEINEELKVEAKLEGRGGNRVKIHTSKRCSSWFLNMFARSTMGVDFENYKDPDNEVVQAFRDMMGENITYNFIHSLVYSLPALEALFNPVLDDKPQMIIDRAIRGILASRRGVQRNNDLADILNDLWKRLQSGNDEELAGLDITEGTLVSQALAFFVGGYDSSHTTVVHLLYYLAKRPDIQTTLYNEIKRIFPEGKTQRVTHDDIQDTNMPYLVACLNESLRIGPSFFRPERRCNKDWSWNGYSIKKGTAVFVATWGLHFNPEYFPKPYEFNPNRFIGEGKNEFNPYCFTPFGHGPRACIGMRFAYESMKVFMVNMLMNWRVELRSDSKLTYKPGNNILAHFDDPVWLDLVARE